VFETYEPRDILFNFVGEGRCGETIVARTEKLNGAKASEPAFVHLLESKVGQRPLAYIRTLWSEIS
jgi:hypothetical protein